MPKKLGLTAWILIMYLAFIFVSFLAIASSSVELDLRNTSGMPTLVKHMIISLGGFLIIFFFLLWGKKSIAFFYRTAAFWIIGALALTVITAIFGKETNEAKRTLVIPIIRLSINAYELAKIAIVIYLARILTDKYPDEETRNKQILTALGLVGLIILLIARHNLSTAGLISGVVFFMLWLAKIPKELTNKIIIGASIVIVFGFMVIMLRPSNIKRSETWHSRIEKFITGSYDITDQGLQTRVAIAKTNLFKFSPGSSDFKYIIPLAYTDYIYAIIGEEMGLVALAIPFAYFFLFLIIAKIAFRQKKPFNMLMVMGFGIMITLQAFIHILVNIGWLPETGQPLPFISLGGTSLWVNSAILGLILAANKYALQDRDNRPTQQQAADTITNPDINDNLDNIIIDHNLT